MAFDDHESKVNNIESRSSLIIQDQGHLGIQYKQYTCNDLTILNGFKGSSLPAHAQ